MSDETKPKFHTMMGAVINLDKLLLVASDRGEAVFLFEGTPAVRISSPSISTLFLAEVANAVGASDYGFQRVGGVQIPPATAASTPEETDLINRKLAAIVDEERERLRRLQTNPTPKPKKRRG